jgi:hypothetical protein
MSHRFRTAFYKFLPWWLTEDEGEKVWFSLGLIVDAFLERLRQGALARFPEYCPPDALKYHGRDRKIVRGIQETDAAFAERLIRWLDDHKVRGNPYALMEQLRAYCGGNIMVRTVDRRGNWFTIAADGTKSAVLKTGNWDWDDGGTERWARFWVIIYSLNGTPWSVSESWGSTTLWSSGVWGTPGATIGTTATVEQVASVRSIIREWKPEGTKCEWIIIAFDDADFNPTNPDPDGYWENWSRLVGSAQRATRLATARYWKGSAT